MFSGRCRLTQLLKLLEHRFKVFVCHQARTIHLIEVVKHELSLSWIQPIRVERGRINLCL